MNNLKFSGGQRVWIEAVESRLLLTVTPPVLIPPSAIGSVFDGVIHLKYHATATTKTHSGAQALSVKISSLSGDSVAGVATVGGETDAAFTGVVRRRTFDATFADGTTISGTVSPNGKRLSGTLRETLNGDVVTGAYLAKNSDVLVAANRSGGGKNRNASQVGTPGSTINFQEGAGSSINAVNAVNEGNTLSASTQNGVSGAVVPVTLQSLDTSFTTSQSLNSQTTANGVSSLAQTSNNANSGSISVSLPNNNTPTTTSTTNAPNSNGVTQASTGDVTSIYAPTEPAVTTSYSSSSYTITSIFGI